MRRRDLLNRIADMAKACELSLDEVREGRAHTIFKVGAAQFSVPRHVEINEVTARSIMRHLESESGEGWWR
jgi:hypothetical protein